LNKYLEALVDWVKRHPDASFNEYVKARNRLRKEHGVEFLKKLRERNV